MERREGVNKLKDVRNKRGIFTNLGDLSSFPSEQKCVTM